MDMTHFEKLESYLPIDLLSFKGLVFANIVVLFFLIVRYFLMVGPFYFLYWSREYFSNNKVHDKKIRKGQIEFELKWSMISSLIFALSAYMMGLTWQLGFTQIYLPLDLFGYWYLGVSFILLSLIHEVYFYWTHIWMHNPILYKRIHAIHHYSIKTTPWASFSFHPLEALVHAIFLPLLVLILPLHPLVIISYLSFMTLTAISNHLGHEILAPKFLHRFFISGQHHGLHHLKFNCNYGLYYRFMDQLFKTENMESQ